MTLYNNQPWPHLMLAPQCFVLFISFLHLSPNLRDLLDSLDPEGARELKEKRDVMVFQGVMELLVLMELMVEKAQEDQLVRKD